MPGRVMYVVRIRISTASEEAWNKWHNTEHIPLVLALPGFLSVRKFRSLASNSREAEYVVCYELRNQAAYENYVKSEEGESLRQQYLDAFGTKTRIERWTWVETFSLTKK
jgi:hypothetical protein